MSPGDLVVCIETGDIDGANNNFLSLLNKGDIYTVQDVAMYPHWEGATAIKVFEISLPASEWYNSTRFRPCRKTSIDDLTALIKERQCENA